MKRSLWLSVAGLTLALTGTVLFSNLEIARAGKTQNAGGRLVTPTQSQSCANKLRAKPSQQTSKNTPSARFKPAISQQSCPVTPLSLPQTVNGTLSSTDCLNTTTSRYFDLYSFAGTAGQQISILLTSSQFDTYLVLLDSNGSLLAEDDDGGGGTNSRIPAETGYFLLTTSGTYMVIVSSYDAGALGSYSLNLMTTTSSTVTLLNHRTTGGPFPSDCTPPPAKSAFAATDETAYQWVHVSGARSTDSARWDFYQPNGSLYAETQPQPMNYNGEVCFWGGIYIAGQNAANLPGTWQVRCYYNGVLLVTDTFTISGSPTPTPTATPTPTITPTPTPTPGQCLTAPAGMIAWWPGDGNANDLRGAGNGTLQSGAAYATGKVEQAFSFDGANARVTTSNTTLNGAYGALTMDAWVYPVSHGQNSGYGLTVLSKTDGDGFSLLINNGFIQPVLRLTTSGEVKPVFNQSTQWQLPLNSWSHVAVTWDGALVKAYLNGQALGSGVAATGTIRNTANANVCLMLGNEPTAPCNVESGYGFNGRLDEIEVFERALSAAEVQAIVIADSAGKCKTTPGNCVQQPSDVYGWWPGDGAATDTTGTHNGSLKNGATYTAGQVGQAFQFDGENDYVDLGAFVPGAQWSLEAWVKPSAVPTARRAILGSLNNCADWALVMQDSKFGLALKPASGSCTDTLTSGVTAVAGTWYHLVGTNDGTTARIYVNGELKGSAQVTANYVGTNSGTWIGGDVCCTEFFPGAVDEPTIYSRALSASEAQSLYAAGSGGKCKTTPGGCSAKADYQFQNTLSSSTGTPPALAQLGGNTFGAATVDGSARTVLRFAAGDGLVLTPTTSVISNQVYTAVVLFSFEEVSGYRRILDFKNNLDDSGLYNWNGYLSFFGATTGATVVIPANTFVQVVLTRDAAKNVTGYVNGVQQISFVDSADLAVIDSNNKLIFFRDNANNEYSAGAIARLRLYDCALTASEVAGLERLPGQTPVCPTITGLNVNRLCNPGAELGAGATDKSQVVPVPGWTTTANFTALRYDAPGSLTVEESQLISGGANYFYGGDLNASSTATQLVSVADEATGIDAGQRSASLQAYLSGYSGDSAEVRAEFLNAGNAVIGTSLTLGPYTGELLLRSTSGPVPAGTRTIRVTMLSYRVTGSDNEGYFDNLSLSLTQGGAVNCPTISNLNPTSGSVGTTVTITGTNLTGVTVRFTGGVTATPNVNSAGTQLTVTVPSGAQTGPITLTKAGCGDVQTSASFTVVPVGNCVTPPTKMVAWWPFDTDTQDIAGTNHGIPSGGPVFTTGKVGQGLQFDGVDDYVSVSVVPTADLLTATGMTFDLWIKPTFTQDREYPIVDFSTLGGLKGIIFGINYSAARGGTFYVAINDTNGVEHLLTSPDFSVANGVFQHLTATYDRETGVAKLYVNGVEKVSQTLGGFTARYALALYIGRFAAAGLNSSVRFAGVMDELEVLSRAMSAAEIQALVSADSAGKCKAQTPCPTVSGMSPSSGTAGTSVTITGANFTGISTVRFANNVSAAFTINSATQITATVPSGAVTGSITLSKPNCADVQTQPFTITTPLCVDVAISTSLTAGTGTTLTVPITVSDTTGKGIIAYDATITFDPAVLRLQSTPTDKTGTLSSNFTITTNSPTSGQLRVSGFGSTALSGAGTLLLLKFDAIGAAQACSNLNFTSFRFNEGTPCSTTTNGRACVTGGGIISGAVSYCISPKPVPGVTLNISGSSTASATTNSSGNYTLPNLNSGNYTLTPGKTGDINGIASFDAALVAQHVVGLTTLSSCQQAAGDTSNNGELSSFDAAFIAQYVVGINNAANMAGTWKFVPPTRSYTNLSSNQTNQNFDAVLVGDVSGNWTSSSLLPESVAYTPTNAPTQAVQVSLPDLTAAQGASLTIPISVGDLTGRGVIAFDLDLTYDAAVLQAQPDPTDAVNTLSSGFTVTANATAGRLRVSGFGTTPLTGSGVLLKLRFTVLGSNGASTALSWQKFVFNEGTPAASLVNGRVTVLSLPTLSFNPAAQTLAVGSTSTLTLLASAAPASDLLLNLTSSNPNVASVPPTVTLPANQTMVTFNVTGSAVGGPVTVSAALPNAPAMPLATAMVTVLRPVACVSAASFTAERLASEAIVAAFGVDMATTTETATTVPLPTALAGTTVRVRDSAGMERLAPLFFVSAGQINYQVPPGTANGLATITVTSGNGIVSTGRMMIATVAPGLFSANANGQGVPAALALRVKADGSQIYEVISTYDAAQQRFVPLPLSLGPEGEQLYLTLFGTGLRKFSGLANVQMRIGGTDAMVDYLGAVDGLIGLDQLNVLLPRTLAGRGEVVITLTVDGQAANPLTVNIR